MNKRGRRKREKSNENEGRMRLWMEQKMNGKMRSAFIKRRLYARRCVGPWHRRERRSQRARWRSEGGSFSLLAGAAARDSRASSGRLRADFPGSGRRRRSSSPNPACAAWPLSPKRLPRGSATVPRRGGSQGPDARRPGPGQGQGDPHLPLYKETLRSRACRYRPERGHEGRKGSRRDQNASLFKRKQKKLP